MCWNTRTFSAASGKKTYFSPGQVFIFGFDPLLLVFSLCLHLRQILTDQLTANLEFIR